MRRGRWKLFWRTVAEIVICIKVGGGWIVLVQYRDAHFELLRYIFGNGETSYDHIERVEEHAWLLWNSFDTPKRVPCEYPNGLCLRITDADSDDSGKRIAGDAYSVTYMNALDMSRPVRSEETKLEILRNHQRAFD